MASPPHEEKQDRGKEHRPARSSPNASLIAVGIVSILLGTILQLSIIVRQAWPTGLTFILMGFGLLLILLGFVFRSGG